MLHPSYTVTVENRYLSSDPRSYIICAGLPTVSNNPIVHLPVCFKTSSLNTTGKRKFTYSEEYTAFIGIHHSVINQGHPKARIEAVLSYKLPLRLGSTKSDGDIITATFPNTAPQLSKILEAKSAVGTFTIVCDDPCPRLEKGQKYVVGVEQRINNEMRIVAAVDYQEGQAFKITPATTMNIRVSTSEAIDEILSRENRNTVFNISITGDLDAITVYEVGLGEFSYQDPAERNKERNNVGRDPSPKPQTQSRPTQQEESHGSRAYQPGQSENLPPEAKALGFTSRNQYTAYKAFVRFNKKHLAEFYQRSHLQGLAKEVDQWIDLLDNIDEEVGDVVDQLCLLSLYDCVLLLDNSDSMTIFENGERIKQMMSICSTIVQVESILKKTRDVVMEFLGDKVSRVVVHDVQQVQDTLDRIFASGNDLTVSTTRLGTTLRHKILNGRVHNVNQAEKPRPLLVSIITDGKPEGENRNRLKSEMKECKKELIRRQNLGDKHVVFQISQVGNSSKARDFLKQIANDTDLQGILHCTEYPKVNASEDPNEDLGEYVTIISKLAGAIFANFDRQANWNMAGSLDDD